MLFLSISRSELVTSTLSKECGIELRLDLFPSIDFGWIEKFLKTSVSPVMLTLRKKSQGGKFEGSESQREELIEQFLDLSPPFFDLEYDMRPQFLQKVFKKYPKTKFILSYHNFEKTPEDLQEIYDSMVRYPVFSCKIAVMTLRLTDTFRMLAFMKRSPRISGICMGEKGQFARVLGPIFGNVIDYAKSQEETAPGQLSLSEWNDIYRYSSLNAQTAIYGLIGDPVQHSVGPIYHNAVFQKRNINAVYIKMKVSEEELADCISFAKEMGIRGLSVTMPLKEKIIPFVDTMDLSVKEIGAVNTLLFTREQLIGTNTDGLGALDAIEKKFPVRGKKVVILGAGGAARAIAYEASKRGANVIILNRTFQKAKELAEKFNCKAGLLQDIPSDYDILVNSSSHSMPIEAQKIKPKTLVMDVIYASRMTDFLKEASLRECPIVYGEEMFLNQAAQQTQFWMGL